MRLCRWLRAAQGDQQDAELAPGAPAQMPAQMPAAAWAAGGGPRYASFTDFFAQHHAPLLDYLYGMTRNRDLAADLAQDTFERAYADAPDLAGIHYPKAWLYTIATRLALNAARHMAHFEWLSLSRQEADLDASGAAADAWTTLPPVTLAGQGDDPAATIVERDAVWGVLAQLPARWRAVLLLHANVGFEAGEIATQLGLSEINVRQILCRAKARFRERYLQLAQKGAS
ncbi:MAG TPA: RNA polymerase sigma factor [Ktedonobacterales bacterium]|nr:RNA polymerase sigma factor [Ktedonobacterales bacterium]